MFYLALDSMIEPSVYNGGGVESGLCLAVIKRRLIWGDSENGDAV